MKRLIVNTFRDFLIDFSFAILDLSKRRGFHLLNDLRYLANSQRQDIKVIFDIGANEGQSTISYKKYFPRSEVHAFEPVIKTFEKFKKNTSKLEKVIANNLALSDSSCEVNILLNKSNRTNSLKNRVIKEDAVERTQTQVFRVDTVDQYCSNNSVGYIDLLKTDTEGYDFEVLQGASNTINAGKIRFIVVEVSFDPINTLQTDFVLVNQLLWQNGYGLVGLYDLGYKKNTLATIQYCNALYMKQNVA